MNLNIYKIVVLLFINCMALSSYSQRVKVRQAKVAAKHTYNQLDVAKKNIDEAITDDKTMHQPLTWIIRGDIYLKLTLTDKSQFKKLAEHPIDDAYYSYQKAYRFDLKKKYTDEIFEQLETIKNLYHNKGIDNFNAKNYNRAYLCFNNVLNIGTFLNKKQIDTAMYYNLALVSELNNNKEAAIDYYKKCIDFKYGGPKVFCYIAQIEKEQGDTAKYINYLKEGIELYPRKNDTLLLDLINHYIDNNNNYLAIEFLKQAINKDPFNAAFYFAQGALYGKLKDYKNAITAYDNAIIIDSGYFDAYFNLGALYFNRGAKLLKSANNISPSEKQKYDKTLKKTYDEFKKSIPYLEKAHLLKPENLLPVTILKDIYLKLRNESKEFNMKYKQFDEILKKLEED